MIELRPYQQEAVNSIWNYFQQGGTGNPTVAMPTGTGKSFVIADFMRTAITAYPATKILMLTHVKELIAQNAKAVKRLWPQAKVGINSAGLRRREFTHPIICGGIASVRKYAAAFGKVSLVLIDECHLVSPNGNTMYQKFIKELRHKNPYVKVIGFSATPYRMKQGIITDGGLFTDLCFDNTRMDAFNNLINEGFLCPLVPKRTELEIDLSQVKIQGGEYQQKDLQETMDESEITEQALDELCAAGESRRSWMIFATGIAHAEHIADSLERRGIPAGAVHSKMSNGQRDKLISDYKKGKLRCIVNMGVLTTGFDHPPMDLIGMLRPTRSPGLWVQMLGRGTRPSEGKDNCLVLDFAGNTARLGPINDPVIPGPRGKGGNNPAPVRCCANCGTYVHVSVRICPQCGYEFPKQSALQVHASSDELIKKSVPVIQDFPVSKLVYSRHSKPGRPDSIKIKYYCGLQFFSYWLCFEHEGYAAKKSRDWWRSMEGNALADIPQSTDEALARIETLPVARWIRVHTNRKYPEILSFTFDENGFKNPPVSF